MAARSPMHMVATAWKRPVSLGDESAVHEEEEEEEAEQVQDGVARWAGRLSVQFGGAAPHSRRPATTLTGCCVWLSTLVSRKMAPVDWIRPM